MVPENCTIERVELISLDATSGSITIDLWTDTYANAPATVADWITAQDKPLISSATKGVNTSLTDWTTALTEGNHLTLNVDSAATVKRVLVAIHAKKTA